jgi:hypothetical protein
VNILLFTYGQWDSDSLPYFYRNVIYIFESIFCTSSQLETELLHVNFIHAFHGKYAFVSVMCMLNRSLTKPEVASEWFRNICQILMTLDFHFYIVFFKSVFIVILINQTGSNTLCFRGTWLKNGIFAGCVYEGFYDFSIVLMNRIVPWNRPWWFPYL